MRFFVLEQRGSARPSEFDTEFYCLEPDNVGEAPRCPACGQFVGMLPWLPPYRVELETWGTGYGDVAFGPGLNLLISERFKRVVEEHGLTGFEGFDCVDVVRVRRHKRWKQKLPPPPYWRVNVMRSQAAVDQIASGMEWEEGAVICPACRRGHDLQRWKRIILEEGTWEGEDIFIARGLPGTFVTSERFKRVCDEHNVTNTVFIPAEQYGYDFYPESNFVRMRELAEMPLGGPLEEKQMPDGEIWRYHRDTKEVLVLGPDRSIRTMFHALGGAEYWESL